MRYYFRSSLSNSDEQQQNFLCCCCAAFFHEDRNNMLLLLVFFVLLESQRDRISTRCSTATAVYGSSPTISTKMRLFDTFVILAVFLSLGAARGGETKCSVCKEVAASIYKYAENKTAINDTIAALQGACNEKFKAHAIKKKVCDYVVKGMANLFPFAIKEFNTPVWDSSNLCNVAGACTTLVPQY